MKKIAILSSTFMVAACLALGQPQKSPEVKSDETGKAHKSEKVALRKLEGKDISVQAKNAFSDEFGNPSDIYWTRSANFDEATFTNKEGKKLTAFYGEDGKLVGTTQAMTFADVPLKGQQEIRNKYKDYKIGDVVFFDDNSANESDMILWAAQFDDEDNYFVELTKGESRIIVKVDSNGALSFFKALK